MDSDNVNKMPLAKSDLVASDICLGFSKKEVIHKGEADKRDNHCHSAGYHPVDPVRRFKHCQDQCAGCRGEYRVRQRKQ